jgi:hypothetical protein
MISLPNVLICWRPSQAGDRINAGSHMLTLGALLVRHTQRSKTRGPDRKSRLGRHSSSGEHYKECRPGRQEGSYRRLQQQRARSCTTGFGLPGATGASSDASDLSHTDLSKQASMITQLPCQSKSRLHIVLQPRACEPTQGLLARVLPRLKFWLYAIQTAQMTAVMRQR